MGDQQGIVEETTISSNSAMGLVDVEEISTSSDGLVTILRFLSFLREKLIVHRDDIFHRHRVWCQQ